MSTSTIPRTKVRQRLSQETFDLLIVGGGINGASIANEATLRGYKVALVEQQDFAFGTSSRSSRLIHGGLRYLEHGEFGLVFESVSERAILAKNARHLVRPTPFIFPSYKGDQTGLSLVDLGLWIYDTLSLFRNYRMHQRLNTNDVSHRLTGITPQNLRGGIVYYDYQTDDARLVLENIIAASSQGCTALSYAKAEKFHFSKGKINSVDIADQLSGDNFSITCRSLMIAGGPWSAELLSKIKNRDVQLRPTKGVHIVVPQERFPLTHAAIVRHPKDQRVHFFLPYYEMSVIGTTDTDFTGNPAHVNTTLDDVRYLIESTNYYFPNNNLTVDDVTSSWAGIRPLVYQEDASSTAAVSREHHIESGSDGVITITGGKLTTYRKIAHECITHLEKILPPPNKELSAVTTKNILLPGAEGIHSDTALQHLGCNLAEGLKQSLTVGHHLAQVYGRRAWLIVDIVKESPSLGQPILPQLPHLWAEVLYNVRHEYAQTLSDILIRRLQLFYRDKHQGRDIAPTVATLMAKELQWDTATEQRYLQDYLEQIKENNSWKNLS